MLKSLNPLNHYPHYDTTQPLPRQLSTSDHSPFITIKSPVCCKFNYRKAKDVLFDTDGYPISWGTARASHRIPFPCNFYYFEVKILDSGTANEIEIGISRDGLGRGLNVGAKGKGYRSNGKFYEETQETYSIEFGPSFRKDDVLGCGVLKRHCNSNEDSENKGYYDVFFTNNGKLVGLTNEPADDTWTWFPTVSLHSRNSKLQMNFGDQPFIFDIGECKDIIHYPNNRKKMLYTFQIIY